MSKPFANKVQVNNEAKKLLPTREDLERARKGINKRLHKESDPGKSRLLEFIRDEFDSLLEIL